MLCSHPNVQIRVFNPFSRKGPRATWYVIRFVDQRAFRVTLDPAGCGRGKLEWRIVEEGQEKRFTSEPYSSFWQRFMVGFLRIFPIDSRI